MYLPAACKKRQARFQVPIASNLPSWYCLLLVGAPWATNSQWTRPLSQLPGPGSVPKFVSVLLSFSPQRLCLCLLHPSSIAAAMASKAPHLEENINYIKTPKQAPSSFEAHDCGVPVTDVSSFTHAAFAPSTRPEQLCLPSPHRLRTESALSILQTIQLNQRVTLRCLRISFFANASSSTLVPHDSQCPAAR